MLKLLIYVLMGVVLLGVIGATMVRMTPLQAIDYQFEDITPLMTKGESGHFSVGPEGDMPAPEFSGESPRRVAARLKDIIEATPRTTLLVGWLARDEPQSIYNATYVTRSGVWAFPDVTSVRVEATGSGARVLMAGRLVYGKYDFGVNEARVRGWLDQLSQ